MLLSDEAPGTFLWEVAFRSAFTFCSPSRRCASRASAGCGNYRCSSLDCYWCWVRRLATPLLPGSAATVHRGGFGVVMALYVLVNYLTDRFPRVERLLEGAPELIITDGELDLPAFAKASLTAQGCLGSCASTRSSTWGRCAVFTWKPRAR
ncbi:MAG: hypothetical protein WKG07_14650 [Hymenobacter sp.]